MKRKLTKLQLTTETLHGLEEQAAEQVLGGVSRVTCQESCTCPLSYTCGCTFGC